MKKVGLIGNGGREHALALALKRGGDVELFAYQSQPNPGINSLARESRLGRLDDPIQVARFFHQVKPDVIFVGPEAPLAAGIVDQLWRDGLNAIGPTQAQARLESDKGWMRSLMRHEVRRGLPDFSETADVAQAAEFIERVGAVAVKPVGLTSGKGVRVSGAHLRDRREALQYAGECIARDRRVLIEEKLEGEEFSLMVWTDGHQLAPMPLCQDFKYLADGDTGGMTGGMGAFTCADGRLPFVSEGDTAAALELMRDVLRAVKTRTGQPYRGALYGQFMNTATGPVVVEFNVRLGDPEAINVLALLQILLVEVLEHIVQGDLSEVCFAERATVSKYLVPPGYPDQAQTVTFALPMYELEAQGLGVRLASVTQEGAQLRTAGSRALALVASDKEPQCAAERIDRAIQQLGLDKLFHFRRDVGAGHVIARKVEHVAALRAGRGAV